MSTLLKFLAVVELLGGAALALTGSGLGLLVQAVFFFALLFGAGEALERLTDISEALERIARAKKQAPTKPQRKPQKPIDPNNPPHGIALPWKDGDTVMPIQFGESKIICPLCHRVQSIDSVSCVACGVPFDSDG